MDARDLLVLAKGAAQVGRRGDRAWEISRAWGKGSPNERHCAALQARAARRGRPGRRHKGLPGRWSIEPGRSVEPGEKEVQTSATAPHSRRVPLAGAAQVGRRGDRAWEISRAWGKGSP